MRMFTPTVKAHLPDATNIRRSWHDAPLPSLPSLPSPQSARLANTPHSAGLYRTWDSLLLTPDVSTPHSAVAGPPFRSSLLPPSYWIARPYLSPVGLTSLLWYLSISK